jgi:hypothetical protein
MTGNGTDFSVTRYAIEEGVFPKSMTLEIGQQPAFSLNRMGDGVCLDRM